MSMCIMFLNSELVYLCTKVYTVPVYALYSSQQLLLIVSFVYKGVHCTGVHSVQQSVVVVTCFFVYKGVHCTSVHYVQQSIVVVTCFFVYTAVQQSVVVVAPATLRTAVVAIGHGAAHLDQTAGKTFFFSFCKQRLYHTSVNRSTCIVSGFCKKCQQQAFVIRACIRLL